MKITIDTNDIDGEPFEIKRRRNYNVEFSRKTYPSKAKVKSMKSDSNGR